MSDDCWIDEFRTAHEARLRECNYPAEIINKLSHDREHWLASTGAVCCRERSRHPTSR